MDTAEDRRTTLLDAAIEIVGTHGMRGLTHRAVDAAAGVPAGSTSNHFRTRDALLIGIMERFMRRERAMVPTPSGPPTSRRELVEALAAYARQSVDEGRTVSLARYAILVESAQRPALRPDVARGADEVDTWALELVRRAGSRDPERDEGIIANYLTGLVLHELSLPSPQFDPAPRIAALIDALGWEEA